MITKTEKQSKALIRTQKLNLINKKFNNEDMNIKIESSIKTPWFCPKCKKITHPIDDYSLLINNMCNTCNIRKTELGEI